MCVEIVVVVTVLPDVVVADVDVVFVDSVLWFVMVVFD